MQTVRVRVGGRAVGSEHGDGELVAGKGTGPILRLLRKVDVLTVPEPGRPDAVDRAGRRRGGVDGRRACYARAARPPGWRRGAMAGPAKPGAPGRCAAPSAAIRGGGARPCR